MEEKNLQILIDQLIMNPNEFSGEIGVSSDTIYNILKKGAKCTPYVKRAIYKKFRNLNHKWFENGIGNMFLEGKESIESLQVSEDSAEYKTKLYKIQERYINELEDRVQEQKEVIESLNKCLNALRGLERPGREVSSG
jgi:predicted transcriptional regulator